MNDTRLAAWRCVFSSDEMPDDDLGYLRQVLESSAFNETSEGLSPDQIVAQILEASGEALDEDLSDYCDHGQPTQLFYEALLAEISRRRDSDDSALGSEEEDEEGSQEDSSDSFTPVDAQPLMLGLDTLYQMIKNDQLDLNPPWQRSVVWSPAKQKELIKSILLGIPIPSIILHLENPGKLGEERYSIIDGKQRLTAISHFLNNVFKLPNFKVDPTHPLYGCRGCYYDIDDKKKKTLPVAYRTKIATTQIPVLQFRDVREARLREVYNLYNVTAVRLNAAEVRNAVYQNNPMHQMLFVLAGENPEAKLEFLEDEELHRFQRSLQRVLPNTNRFAALAFLSRYLGYSRAAAKEGEPFRAITTREAINRYFDVQSERESGADTGKEIVRVFSLAQDLFDIDPDDPEASMAFFVWKKGKRQFEALQAVTSMVCAKVLDAAIDGNLLSLSDAKAGVREVVAGEEYPDKQQYKTIWDHQARMVLGLLSELSLDADALRGLELHTFVAQMQDARLQSLA